MFARISALFLAVSLFVLPAIVFADDGSAVAASVGSGSASASQADQQPQLSDVSTAEHLWKDGSFVGVAILVVYVGLFAATKLDKKHAFYWATGLAFVATLVESVRQGNVPGLTQILHLAGPTLGILLTGPGHVKVPSTEGAGSTS